MSEAKAIDEQRAAPRPAVIVDDVRVTFREFTNGIRPSERRRLFGRGSTRRRAVKVNALRGVSFTVAEGESVGVLGRNGAGKSTLMSVIAGLTPPTSGAVFAESNPALLAVNAALMPNLSGARNIRLGAMALGLSRREADQRFDSITDFADLGDFIDLPMRVYSSGMASRLRFAIATSVTHRILIIDEALSVGDEQFARRSKERIDKLRAEAGTVFLVSHSLPSILANCERAIWLDEGRLVMDGPASEVVSAYRTHQRRTEVAYDSQAASASPVLDIKHAAAAMMFEEAAALTNHEEALRGMRAALTMHPEPPLAWTFLIGERAASARNYDLADAMFRDGIRRQVGSGDQSRLPQRYVQLGSINEARRRPAEAAVAYRKSLEVDPEAPAIYADMLEDSPERFSERKRITDFIYENLDEIRDRAAAHETSAGGDSVFTLWLAGLEAAPPTVRACHQHLVAATRRHVVTLDHDNLAAHAGSLLTEIAEWGVAPSHLPALLQLSLLTEHGGVWLDPCGLVTADFDTQLDASLGSGFFAYKKGPFISPFLMAAKADGRRLTALAFEALLAFHRHMSGRPGVPPMAFQYVVEALCRLDDVAGAIWEASPRPPESDIDTLAAQLAKPYDADAFAVARAQALVHRLPTSFDLADASAGSLAEHLASAAGR